jgi:YVTN family beta-propeller protein
VTDLAKVPNKLAAEYQFTFNTGVGDKTPPTITSIIPKASAGSVFVNTKIQLFFSEAMNSASLTNSFTITWKNGNVVTNVPGSSSWDPEYKVMTFSPTGSLKEATSYTVKVSNGAKDISGNSIKGNYSATFTTVLVANPTLLYLEPGTALKTDVSVETPVVADFSEPINPYTVDLNSFKLFKGATSGIPVNGKFEFLNANSRVVFRPDAALDFSQSYTIALTTGIKDVSSPNAGTFQGKTVTFTTSAKPGKPIINFISPPSGVIGDTIIIGGKGFDPDPVKDKVEFYVDGITYIEARVKSASLTSLKVAVPVGAKSGPIRVIANGIQADYLSPFDFYVVQKYSDPCNTVTGSAQTGGNSHAVALDITAATAYVTNSGTNNVSVIDVASMTVKKTINVGEYPLMIDINPSGTRAYVTNFLSHTVSVIDLTTNTVTKTIDVGYNPYGVKVSPDGKWVYVAHYNSEYENVSVIDADPASGGFDHVVADIKTGTRNKDLDVDANATTMVVTGDDGVKIIEITKTELGFDYSTYNSTSGTKTSNAAILPEAGLAVVTTMDGTLLFIDINKGNDTFGAVIAKSTSGGLAGNVQPDVTGVFLYVSYPHDNQVTVYKMTYGAGGSGIESTGGLTLTEISKIPVGMSPQGMTINTFDNELYVVNELGTTGSTGSVTKVTICCAGRSPSDDIVALALYIQGLINTGAISQTDGKTLINKLNDALANVATGKNKTAINDLNTFINKVNSSMKTGKIPKGPGQKLIDDANAIIAKLNGAKSGETESDISDDGLSNRVQKSESIPVSKLGLIYPNPFSQTITVNYEIAENKEALTKVQLMVYDVNGRLVSTLVDQIMQSGCFTTLWNGDNDSGGAAPYGTYFVLFRAGTVKEVSKIVLIKPR